MQGRDLEGRIALVTGASRGIGWHTAKALLAGGAKVGITGRERETIQAAAKKLGGECQAFVCDQRDPAAVEAMAKEVMALLGTPDLLVCNAGVMKWGAVDEMSLETWNDVIDTNLTGTFVTVRSFLGAMRGLERGDIFIISSMSGKKGDPKAAAYAASKFGLQGFAQALMYEVRRDDIRVMVLNPSSVDTGEDPGRTHGKGLHLHAADLGAMIVHLAALPGRTMIRDMDVFGTNPFRD